MKNLFTDHPKNVGETYLEHCKHASIFALNLLVAGMACLIHAFFPFLFKKTASDLLIKMTRRFVTRMPVVEDNIANLSKYIEEKMVKCQTKTNSQ